MDLLAPHVNAVTQIHTFLRTLVEVHSETEDEREVSLAIFQTRVRTIESIISPRVRTMT